MRIVVLPGYETLSLEAGRIVAEAVQQKPGLVLGLPTGNTPLGMYAELVRRHRRRGNDGLDFSGVRTFNLDEYFGLPRDHPKSYHTYMHHHFFEHVNVLPANIHIPDGSSGIDPAAESTSYEQSIRGAGGIDLLIVGIGTNGHIAFNEPGSSFTSRTRLAALAPETIAAARRHFDREEDIPRTAITMGIGTMLEARRILLLAHGAGKSEAVRCALHGPISEDCPASALRTHPDVTALCDNATP